MELFGLYLLRLEAAAVLNWEERPRRLFFTGKALAYAGEILRTQDVKIHTTMDKLSIRNLCQFT